MNKVIQARLNHHRDALVASKQNLKAIFDIMFCEKDNILCEGNDGFRIYRHTYGQIHGRICNAAGHLYEAVGAKGEYIALEMDNGPDWVVAFWAILMSGNKPYLVNMRYPVSLTKGILTTLNVRYAVCEKETALGVEGISMEALGSDHAPAPADVFEDELAFSSSATSMNEVVCFYSGKQIAAQILNFETIVKLNPRIAKDYKGQIKQLAFLPFYHIFGLFAVYFWYSFFGAVLVFLRDYSADTILKTVQRHEVTHIFAVPMLWHTIEKQVWAAAREGGEKQVMKLQKGMKTMTALQNICPGLGAAIAKKATSQVTDQLFGRSVMFCISGGSYIRDSALELLNALGYSLHNGFGMSEVGITSVELRKKSRHLNENSIGRPFDSVQYKIEDGQLYIRGTSLCTRKLVNGEPREMDGWFATGDLVQERSGNYFILGRMGDMVIGENGENINPDTVEKLFAGTSAKAYSVLGIKDGQDEALSMVVQLGRYASSQSAAALRQELYSINNTLPQASSVKKFYFTFEDLAPPTAVKVSRTQLLKKIENGEVGLIAMSELEGAFEAAGEESPLMQQVRTVIARVLGIEADTVQPGTHVFYDLGATSIQYFSILSELASHFEISNYSKSDQYCYTLKEMTDYIERHL